MHKMRGLAFAAALCGVSVIAASVNAEETTHSVWREMKPWDIRLDPDVGCYMETSYDTGTYLRIGIDGREGSERRATYFVISNPIWKSITRGKQYELRVLFDKDDLWEAPAQVIGEDGGPVFLHVMFKGLGFLDSLQASKSLTVLHGQEIVDKLSLKSIKPVTKEVANCQVILEVRHDPFASPKSHPANK